MKLIMLKYKRHLSGEQKEYIRVNRDEAKGKQKDEATLEYFFCVFQNWTLHLWRRVCNDCDH